MIWSSGTSHIHSQIVFRPVHHRTKKSYSMKFTTCEISKIYSTLHS